MSSNREVPRCEAILHRQDSIGDQRTVGPIRLPDEDPTTFVAEFNREYEGMGLTIFPLSVQDEIDE